MARKPAYGGVTLSGNGSSSAAQRGGIASSASAMSSLA